MGSEVTFYDYVDGENVIHVWLDGPAKKVKAKINNILLHLEATPIGQWQRPWVDTLTDECDGLFEIRAARSRLHYRILGYHGPNRREATLLHAFIKKGNRVPPAECQEAFRRIAQLNENPRGWRLLHDYR